jgi:carbon storage regulator CsrA
MLILTRKRNESIRIGEHIVVRVMRTASGSVKIGIEAPDSVRIMRGEIHDGGDFHDAAPGEPVHDDCDADCLMLQH